MRTTLALLPILVLAACLQPAENLPSDCPPNEPPILWGPPFWTESPAFTSEDFDPLIEPPTDPDQPYDVLVIRKNQTIQVESGQAPSGWRVDSQVLGEHNTSNLIRFRAVPGAGASEGHFGVELGGALGVGDCVSQVGGTLGVKMPEPARGDVASAGKGVLVYTAGFWENGTLFYTNMDIVESMETWPRAGWYEWGGGEPLAVYVYDEESSEKGPPWAACTPASQIATSACVRDNYSVTIPGFNEALKGLSTNTARVVWVPPSQAYTRAGVQSTHPLYGDAIVFYIRVVEVHEAQCGLPPPDSCGMPGGARQKYITS